MLSSSPKTRRPGFSELKPAIYFALVLIAVFLFLKKMCFPGIIHFEFLVILPRRSEEDSRRRATYS